MSRREVTLLAVALVFGAAFVWIPFIVARPASVTTAVTVTAKPTPSSSARLITNLVRHRLSLRLHVIEGDDWYTQGRCREQVTVEPQAATRFVCALWSQGLHKTANFYASAVDVRCIAPLTECSWQARNRIEAK